MAVSIQTIADEILKDVPGCPLFERQWAVIEALKVFCRRTEFFTPTIQGTYTSAEIDTFNNNALYLDTPDIKKKPIRLKTLYVSGSKTGAAFRRCSETLTDFESIFNASVKYYDFPPDDHNQVAVFPFQDADFDSSGEITLTAEVVLIPLDTITEIENEIYFNWQDAIKAGAKAGLLVETKKPWTDYKLAGLFAAKFNEEINKGITHKRLIENGGELSVQMRPFI